MTYTKRVKRVDKKCIAGPGRPVVGSGHDYSLLFIALARANDIPARYVSGITRGQSDVGHGWPEAYVRDLGWVPFDPTWEQSREVSVKPPTDARIILDTAADGASGMSWTYFGAPLEVDKAIKVEFWTVDHEGSVLTDCGAERAELPMSVSQNDWSRYQCKGVQEAQGIWSSCLVCARIPK